MTGKKFIADFHIHSHFSLATSKNLVPEHLEYWAKIKGINVVGTGDCIHPGWLKELKEKLEPADNGLFRLKKEYSLDFPFENKNIPEDVFFILTGEISNIYKKNDRTRKVHNLCVLPDFGAVEHVQKKLKNFNLESDGRPILGLDSKHLLEIVLDSSAKSFLVPAHIWTPWFSVLGSKSGFDNIKECYEDLTGNIFALETGLSSDPAMNWACGFLNDFKLISNSDAHSPEKLGREANIFETAISYEDIYRALSGDTGFAGTIEFFPQEGKYHYDGHRKCGVLLDPLDTLKHDGICPVCGKPVTKGVMYRVAELADRSGIEDFANKRDFHSITALPDLLAEIMGKKSSSAKDVRSMYLRLIGRLGPEFHILLYSDTDEIREEGGEILSEGIKRLREGDVIIEEGFDGEYGRIRVFSKEDIKSFTGKSLFPTGDEENKINTAIAHSSSVKFDIKSFQLLKNTIKKDIVPQAAKVFSQQTAEQTEAVEHYEGPCMVLAGPGSGKTRILTERVLYLIERKGIRPENILSVTFSNKAAGEMRQRITGKNPHVNPAIYTFHAFGLSVLKSLYRAFERPEHFYIADQEEKNEILDEIGKSSGLDSKKTGKILSSIERYKQGMLDEVDRHVFNNYNRELVIRGAFDLDDLIYLPVELFEKNPEVLDKYRKQFPWILVDEYQDINAKQYEFLIRLAGKDNPNLFAIGDPDQAIYGFRGSDVGFIDKLREDYPGIKTINLSKSFRCPDPVIKAAAQVLRKKEQLTGKKEKIRINIQESDTDKSEADWIAAQIEKMIGGVRSFSIDSGISDGNADEASGSFSDFAVLCRTSLMFDVIIKAFSDHGIAHQIIGTEPFYKTRPFSTIIGHFRKIYYHLANIESSALRGKDETRKMIEKREEITKILGHLMENMEISGEDRTRLNDLAAPYGNDYDKFFTNISTRDSIDEYNEKAEAVSIMTIHASKGLEFKTVFIPGCEEGIIPFELFGKKGITELAEEERLFYVGMTRTSGNLYLSHAKKRAVKGRILYNSKSPFLGRLEKELIKFEKREKKPKNDDGQLDLFG